MRSSDSGEAFGGGLLMVSGEVCGDLLVLGREVCFASTHVPSKRPCIHTPLSYVTIKKPPHTSLLTIKRTMVI